MSSIRMTLAGVSSIAGVKSNDTLSSWLKRTTRALGLPLLGILVFLFIWQVGAKQIDTSLGQFPGPEQVYQQAGALVTEHMNEREREAGFYERQEKRNAERVAKDPDYVPKIRDYTGKPTFFDTHCITSSCVANSGTTAWPVEYGR